MIRFLVALQLFALIAATLYKKEKTIKSTDLNDGEYRFIYPKEHRIASEIRSVRLSPGVTFQIRDGRTSTFREFECRRRNYLVERISGQPDVTVSFPIKFVTETRKLIIQSNNLGYRDRISIVLEAFPETFGCDKSLLNGTVKECDTIPANPRANSCSVNLQCREYRQQSGDGQVCNFDGWSRDLSCQPIEEILQDCDVDEEFEISDGCPYQLEEIAMYYVLMEPKSALLGRSSGRRRPFSPNQCRPFCRIKRPRRNQRLLFGKWILCRSIWKTCRKGYFANM